MFVKYEGDRKRETKNTILFTFIILTSWIEQNIFMKCKAFFLSCLEDEHKACAFIIYNASAYIDVRRRNLFNSLPIDWS